LRSIPIRVWVRRIPAVDFGNVDGCPGFGGIVGRNVRWSESIVSLTVKVSRPDGAEGRCEMWSSRGPGFCILRRLVGDRRLHLMIDRTENAPREASARQFGQSNPFRSPKHSTEGRRRGRVSRQLTAPPPLAPSLTHRARKSSTQNPIRASKDLDTRTPWHPKPLSGRSELTLPRINRHVSSDVGQHRTTPWAPGESELIHPQINHGVVSDLG
jgi:hypothetical protein